MKMKLIYFETFYIRLINQKKQGQSLKFPNTTKFYELIKQFKHTKDIINLKERYDIVFGKYDGLKVIFESTALETLDKIYSKKFDIVGEIYYESLMSIISIILIHARSIKIMYIP